LSTIVKVQVLDFVALLLAAGQWFSPVSYINKTDRHDITEILLKMALNTMTLTHKNAIRYMFTSQTRKQVRDNPYTIKDNNF
jgi:hypothetical protein